MSRRDVVDLYFSPRSIVVYGASADPAKLSGRPLDYLRRFGYEGDLYAVNPRRERVQGVPAYPRVEDVPGPVDLAVVVVPAPAVPEAVAACAAAGVGAVTVFASGFAEAPGEDGAAAEARIGEIAAAAGMRVMGPNCLGSFAEADRAFATFSTAFDTADERPDAPVGLVSQSGAVGTFTYSEMTAVGLGVRYFANTGNQVDVSVLEMLGGLVDRDDVSLLLGHLEGFGDEDEDALAALAARARAAGKPLVLLKSGRTPVGERAIGAHTGSRGGDDERFTSSLTGSGGIRAESMQELVDLAQVFAAGRTARGPRVSIVTQSGGAGALASDVATDVGLVVEPWAPDARSAVAQWLPYFGSTANPIDVTGALINDVSILRRTLDVTAAAEDTDVVLVVLGNSDAAAVELSQVCVEAAGQTDKPFVVSWTGGDGRARQLLRAAGIATYDEPARAVRAIGRLVEHGRVR